MNNKKSILKKYTGKGGIVGNTVKAIPGTLKGMGKNLLRGKIRKALDPGNIVGGTMRRAGNLVANAVRVESNMQKAKEAPYKKALDDAMAGRESYSIEDDIKKLQDRNSKINKLRK